MMKSYDVVIIGAGVVGASIARELSRFRLDVALLEKEAEVGFGVSKSNSGIIHPGTQLNPRLLMAGLCVAGNRLIRGIARALDVDFKETGELIVAFDADEAGRLLELKRQAERLGVRRLEIVGPSWLRSHEPNLNTKAVAALHAPAAGIISPYRLVYALCENASENGVEIHTLSKVEHIEQADFFEIATAAGVFKARRVVNAAGLFADDVARLVGIDDFDIKPRKGEEFLLDKKKAYLTRHLLFPLPSPVSKGVLVTRTADGNPMIGPTAEETQDKNDLATTEEGLNRVLSGAQKLVPCIDAKDIIAYFAGLRPAAGKDFIIRREANVPGFINVAGIQSPGLTAAPAIAAHVLGLLKEDGLELRRKPIFRRRRRDVAHLFSMPQARLRRLIARRPSYGDIVCRCEMISAAEIEDAVRRGSTTLDGIKFRTRAQAGRCHGNFCTTRIMKILSREAGIPLTAVTKRGPGSEIVKGDKSRG